MVEGRATKCFWYITVRKKNAFASCITAVLEDLKQKQVVAEEKGIWKENGTLLRRYLQGWAHSSCMFKGSKFTCNFLLTCYIHFFFFSFASVKHSAKVHRSKVFMYRLFLMSWLNQIWAAVSFAYKYNWIFMRLKNRLADEDLSALLSLGKLNMDLQTFLWECTNGSPSGVPFFLQPFPSFLWDCFIPTVAFD